MGSCCCCADKQGVYDKVSYYDEEEEEMNDIGSSTHGANAVIVGGGGGLSVDTTATASTIVTMTRTNTSTMTVHGIDKEDDDNAATEEDEGNDDADSVEDPLYYTQYRVVPNPITLEQHTKRSEDIVRENYERALFTLCGGTGTTTSTLLSQIRKNMIYEYEEHKSNCFNMEYHMTAESLLREARETLAPEDKNALYREALMHTTDLERKQAVKDEYNEVYRARHW